MPCEGNSSCDPGLDPVTLGVVAFTSAPDNLSTSAKPNRPQGESVSTFSRGEIIFILVISTMAVCANLLALFVTRYASGGQSPTMVFIRMLCVADFLIGCYGVGKMLMFLHVEDLMINFFLPESLLFTASTAACLSLLVLNLDRSVKICAPLWYSSNIDKPSMITIMVFLSNGSFVVGFLPLLGWNMSEENIFEFFDFFPWHYLLFVGVLWLLCVMGSTAILLYVRRRFDLTIVDHRHMTYHLAEVEKYYKLRVTLVIDLVSWCVCYVPFLVFLGLSCRSCLFRGRSDLNTTIYHFTPVLMFRAILGAATQMYRTVRVQGLMKSRRSSTGSPSSPVNHHHHRCHSNRTCSRGHNGVTTISYSNPLCDQSITDFSVVEDVSSILNDVTNLSRQISTDSRRISSDSQTLGIANLGYRPSIGTLEFGQGVTGTTVENTAL